ncbi:polyhydroxyalkanoate synthesis repressor PhaR [Qipengyuania sp. JC766]|uniref:polyhydroxyalkanoate synthesis repressor PhaR n=1 Tax=Qipengyuania sp. JC766 TaxID=3232139 RepID=UPI00345B0E60
MAKRKPGSDEPITIKKYANRRLYNTGSSSYITLDDLAKMTREGAEFVVIDAKSGDDITGSILTQIIMEEEAGGAQMLPVSFLRDVIAMYGNSMQALMPSYLEASMKNFRENREQFQEAFMSGNPLAKLAENNLAMMRAMGEAFMPGLGGSRQADTAPPAQKQSAQPAAKDDDIAALRDQMAAMQKRLDELGK